MQALNTLPDNGVPSELLTVETENEIVQEDNGGLAVGPPTDNPSEDIVYNETADMSSFLPVGKQQQQEHAAKGEPRSPLLKQAFNSIVKSTNTLSDPHKAIKKVIMKTLGERDYAAQATMHHLPSLKLHSSSFNIIPVSLNGSRRVRVNQESDRDVCTDYSLLDVYANRERYDSSSDVHSMNFVKFAATVKVVNAKLTKLPPDVIPHIFPTFSSNPTGGNFPAYCKYQLLRYKPWKLTPNNAWDYTKNLLTKF